MNLYYEALFSLALYYLPVLSVYWLLHWLFQNKYSMLEFLTSFLSFYFKLFLIKFSRHSKKFHWGNENHRLKGLWKRHYHVIDFRRSNSVWRNGDTFIDKGWKSFVCLKHKRKHDMHHVTHVDSSWDYFPTEWFVDTWKWVIFMSHIIWVI